MPFVIRENGKVTSVTQWPQPGIQQEELPEGHADLIAFRAERQKGKQDEKVKRRLSAIDVASVRAIREYIAAQPNAPKAVKDREAEAAAERAKLK